jgi:hypothetical protein
VTTKTDTLLFRLSERQLRLLSSIHHSSFLKKKLIESTHVLLKGRTIHVSGDYYHIDELLGEGLIGTVYKVTRSSDQCTFALKQTRADFSFYRESLRLEDEVSKYVKQHAKHLKVIHIHTTEGCFMLKDLCSLPTLQQIIFNNTLSECHISSLEMVLSDCAVLFRKKGVLLDLSPKNIGWDGNNWFLIDCGPKLHSSPFEKVLQTCKWDDYLSFYGSRVHTPNSEPSVLSEDVSTISFTAKEMVFVKDWLEWFPLSDHFVLEYFYVDVNDNREEDEFLYIAGKDDNGYSIFRQSKQAAHPLIRFIAIEKWKKEFPEIPPPSNLQFDWHELPLNEESEPITWNEFLAEITPIGLGKSVKELCGVQSPMKAPTLSTKEYKHWKDLFSKPNEHQVVDIFCHKPLETEPISPVKAARKLSLKIPFRQPFLFANIDVYTVSESDKLRLILPGFRATNESAHALVNELIRKKVGGSFLLAQIGAKNPQGQMLVTAGRWELVMLWEIIEYCSNYLKKKDIEIIAASHGAIAAWLIACMHPSVKKIILDSPLLNPLQLLSEIAKFRKEEEEVFKETLRQHGMPHVNYRMFENPHQDLHVLSMRPEKDLFMDLCGNLNVGKRVVYQGGHASTLRHDSSHKGIPSICVDSIVDFLSKENEGN